ncbi:probable Guanine nucleotide exchange factor SRM1 [Saccharomycodes ludwigii]|uniref:Probable Guanine nucleotide exchange factor SRM1 n=1 Tax=Saccharomycodes ludwigii TaxID=36035 RepID=A0A376B5Y9_9ASCO|nr:hypothetical protein SCDLUD_001045 [Saccharomycodes ludwigii]KAH3903409.1 hypothetical protein SCDLUD_001045 [Saccharomycodes ludwigii]SSD60108.1 probable Guanine nucleotide exchange factor SRM1 [Saccharomycodes ludwigii]
MKRSNSSTGSSKAVRSHKRIRSVHLHSTLNKNYNIINSQDDYKHMYISAKPLDIFVWGTGSMCELGLGPSHKNKEVKRPRLNPFLQKNINANDDKAGGKVPFIVSFCCGGMHTIALTDDNKVLTWGTNDAGALGRDTSDAKEQLKDMDEDNSDDDDDGDLNDLESTPMEVEGLPSDTKIVQVIATDNFSCVLYETGDIFCWGTFRCNEGILGLYKDEIKIQTKPWKLPLAFTRGKKIVQLAPGKDHVLFLDECGIVYAWGNGQQYQLGRKVLERFRLKTLDPRPFGLDNVKYISSGENHSFALDKNGDLYAWGLNQFGQCGVSKEVEDGALITVPTKVLLPEDAGKVSMVAAGEHHSLVLMENGDLYVFGRIDMFEVGLDIKSDKVPKENLYEDVHGKIRAVPVPTKMPNVKPFKYVASGSHHSLAITTDGVVFSWGFGETYAVGLGPSGDDIEIPTRIKNTATKDHDIIFVSGGGQFSCSGGIKLSDEKAEEREKAYEDED